MKTAIYFVTIAILLVTQTALAQQPTRVQDPNAPVSERARGAATKTVPGADIAHWVFGQTMANEAQSDPNLCAIVILPGPATSFNIRFGVFNVAPDRLDFLIMDSFRALDRESLLHESVFDTVAPPQGL
jgi:hypothetical protein